MGRRKKYSDEGASLFDAPTPIQLPYFTTEQLTNKQDFLSDIKYTLGMVAKISRQVTEKVARGETPNYQMGKFLTDITQTVKQSMTSYNDIQRIENDLVSAESKIDITFTPPNSIT